MGNPEKCFVQVLNENDVDLNSVCRLCFAAESNLVSISAQLRSAEHPDCTPLTDLVYACVQQEVKVDDEYPQNICHTCLNFLVAWSEFKNKCVKTSELFKNWHSIKVHLESLESNEDNGTKNNGVKSADQKASENEDYWILVVDDDCSGDKKTPSNIRSNVISLNRLGNNKTASPQKVNPQQTRKLLSNTKKLVSNSAPKKVVTFSSDTNMKGVSTKARKNLDQIQMLIAQNKYQMSNGSIVINTADLASINDNTANKSVSGIRSAGDLLRQTSFASDDDGDDDGSNTSESIPLTSNSAVDRIQQLIERNDAILKTSAVRVSRARKVFKSATQQQTQASVSPETSSHSVQNYPKSRRKNQQESRKRKRSHGPQHNIAYQQNIVSCDVCGERFFNYESLLHHDQISHMEYPRLFQCSKCEQEYLTDDHLNLHMISYHGTESSSEDEGGGASKKGKSNVRIRNSGVQQSDSELQSMSCGICDEKFMTLPALRKHLETCENSVLLV